MNATAKTACLAAMTALTVLAAGARGGSIWAKGTTRTQATYTDDTARHLGDSLTIVIREHSKIENDTSRNLEKKGSRAIKASGGDLLMGSILGELGKKAFHMPTVDASGSSENKFDGKAAYDSDRSVEDRITVTIEDVLPNGNLVVLGKRIRETDGDKQIIQVSGIVRPSDVTFANTVLSEQVADFHVVYLGKGQDKLATNPGWLSRLMNLLSPF